MLPWNKQRGIDIAIRTGHSIRDVWLLYGTGYPKKICPSSSRNLPAADLQGSFINCQALRPARDRECYCYSGLKVWNRLYFASGNKYLPGLFGWILWRQGASGINIWGRDWLQTSRHDDVITLSWEARTRIGSTVVAAITLISMCPCRCLEPIISWWGYDAVRVRWWYAILKETSMNPEGYGSGNWCLGCCGAGGAFRPPDWKKKEGLELVFELDYSLEPIVLVAWLIERLVIATMVGAEFRPVW
jgi:hypothetical protein